MINQIIIILVDRYIIFTPTYIGNSSERRFNQAICNTIITIFLKVDCLDCWEWYIHLSKYWWIVMYSILCSTDIGNLTQIKVARFSQAIYTFNYRNIFEGRLSCILIYSDTFRHLSLLYWVTDLMCCRWRGTEFSDMKTESRNCLSCESFSY